MFKSRNYNNASQKRLAKFAYITALISGITVPYTLFTRELLEAASGDPKSRPLSCNDPHSQAITSVSAGLWPFLSDNR